ncbi:Heterokaryon incompatibility protein 6 OR allele [Lachnellula suecica]|uniref:Heterokaryon incompatibility protein 6 OR allele n=1 Tax=Lachnellula suecica TaxID=602035 RepID=A0A8T9BWI7_9HELO|nr:Heterokaryon incompatibility protein 6 OR allele [Lachnellula suecica]
MSRQHQQLYETIPQLKPGKIRILTLLKSSSVKDGIQCELHTLSQEDNPSYVALSYLWGNENPTRNISVNGEDFPAPLNLYSALEHFCDARRDIHIWVDAVCIDQKNPSEKREQIQLMRDVYSEAAETWVWLGEEMKESNRAITLIKRLSAEFGSPKPGPEQKRQALPESWDMKDELIALDEMLAREYWYRAWVVQEIAVSKNITLFCGDASFDWDELFNAAYYVDGAVGLKDIIRTHRANHSKLRGDQGTRGGWGTVPGGRNTEAGLQRIISVQSVRNDMLKTLEDEPPDSLLSLLHNHRSTDAREPEDKYIALKGLIQDDCIGPVPSSVESARDVYIWAAEAITRQQQKSFPWSLALDFLDCAGLPTNKGRFKRKIGALPSWVPDWSYHERRATPLLLWQFSGNKETERVLINAPGRSEARLLARGRHFDHINGIGSSQWSSYDNLGVKNPEEDQYSRSAKYKTGEEFADAVWKTCVLNRNTRGLAPAPEWGDLFFAYIYNQPWYIQNKGFKICGHTLEEIALAEMHRQSLKTGGVTQEEIADEEPMRQQFLWGYEPELLTMLSNALAMAVGRRRLATTRQGYLCLVPFDTEVGDVIAILSDCHAPVVLRTRGDHYSFIGTCYVHGIMQGEAVTSGWLNSQDFDIR